MAVFLAPLAPIAKAALIRGGAFLANKFLRRQAKQKVKESLGDAAKEQIKKKFVATVQLKPSSVSSVSSGTRVPIAGGRIPPRTGASYLGTGAKSKIAATLISADKITDVLDPEEVQAPQDDFFRLNELIEKSDNKKRLEDILAGKEISKK